MYRSGAKDILEKVVSVHPPTATLGTTMGHDTTINYHCVIHMHPGKSLVACVVLLLHVHGARSCA